MSRLQPTSLDPADHIKVVTLSTAAGLSNALDLKALLHKCCRPTQIVLLEAVGSGRPLCTLVTTAVGWHQHPGVLLLR